VYRQGSRAKRSSSSNVSDTTLQPVAGRPRFTTELPRVMTTDYKTVGVVFTAEVKMARTSADRPAARPDRSVRLSVARSPAQGGL
jgi:hypothetical protein